MANITLWGRLNSANVQKAVWALEELGLSYAVEERGGKFGGLQEPALLAMNPNGLVPILQDGELTLWESHAIVRYLCSRYGAGELWPEDPLDRAVVDQWTDWTATQFQPAWISVFWLLVRTPPEQRDGKAIEKATETTLKAMRLLDQRLQEVPFLGGERLTYADIVAGVSLYRWTTMEIDRPALPSFDAWHGRLLERPAFRKAVNVPYEDLRGRLSF